MNAHFEGLAGVLGKFAVLVLIAACIFFMVVGYVIVMIIPYGTTTFMWIFFAFLVFYVALALMFAMISLVAISGGAGVSGDAMSERLN